MSTAAPVSDQEDQVKPQQLSDEGRKGLENLVNGCLKEELSARRSEVREAWRQRSFGNGIQYLWWDTVSNCYMNPSASGQELPRYMDVYDIYSPHKRSFTSILSQNPPGVNFVPDDLQRSLDVTAASYAEKMRHRVDRLVHMKDRQGEVAGYFCTDGRTMSRTWVNQAGELQIGTYGVLETKVPIFARSMKKWGYCVISEEEDKWGLKEEFEEFADDISGEEGTSETSYERYARLGILANKRGASDAEALKNLSTRHIAWIRPSRYLKASKELQAEYKSLYPEGVRVTMISGKAVECVPEKMEAALKVDWPTQGHGSSRPSLLRGVVDIQVAFNDAMNMLREHFDFSIPATWVTDAVDSEALAEQRSAPGVIHQITIPNGASINDLVMQEQVAQLPTELVQNIDRLLSLAQFTTGDLPSLYGDGTPDQETASGQKMLSDQAKGQLSPAWDGVKGLFAGTYQIAVILAAKLLGDRDSVAIQGSGGRQQFNPAAILDGIFGCHADPDSTFPETIADQRASLASITADLAQAGPEGLAILMHPDNLALRKQYSGLKDFIIVAVKARNKQMREIDQLLQETPIPDQTQIPQWQQSVQQAKLAGQPPPEIPLTSSVPVGKYDYNQAELDKCIEWLSDDACFEEIQKGNQRGVDNVTLHADAHAAAIKAAAPPPQFKPPNVTLTAQITDPVAIAALLGEAGAQTTPENIEGSNIAEEQNTAADTQHKAAQAQHQSVLAAKEAVAPVKPPTAPGEKKNGR